MPLAPALSPAPLAAAIAAAAPGSDPVARARDLIRGCLAERGRLLAGPLERRAGGYARTLLFAEGALSLWAMVWDAGAATAIHDHHCACCFAVLSGELAERRFERVGEGAAALAFEAVRRPGFSACLVPDRPNIHQMVNLSGAEAVSVHAYGFDHRLHANSVEREYRLAPAH